MTISAFLPVFNEEKRIADALTSLMWCDEIILVDKNSTDKTLEIAAGFGSKVKVYSMDNTTAYDSSEWNVFLDNCSCEWTILFTASDVIHPKLAIDILSLIRQKDFHFDIIKIPFRRFVLGLESKRSPWYSKLSPKVVKKSSIILNLNGVHDATRFIGNEMEMSCSDIYCMYHLTHETVDIMMDRHIRYWKGEANSADINLKASLKSVLNTVIKLIFFKKTPILGYDGFMLMFSFLTYQMMSYVYKWEVTKGRAPEKYKEIKFNLSNEWKKNLYINRKL